MANYANIGLWGKSYTQNFRILLMGFCLKHIIHWEKIVVKVNIQISLKSFSKNLV